MPLCFPLSGLFSDEDRDLIESSRPKLIDFIIIKSSNLQAELRGRQALTERQEQDIKVYIL